MSAQIRIQAIRERCKTATPGPWDFDGRDIFRRDLIGAAPNHLVAPLLVGPTFHPDQAVRVEDAEFMAAARQDVPDLLAVVVAAQTVMCSVEDMKITDLEPLRSALSAL